MNPVKSLQKKILTYLAAFWVIGIDWLVSRNFDTMSDQLPLIIVILLFIVQIGLLIWAMVVLWRNMSEAAVVYKKNPSNSSFWLTTNQFNEELEDERTVTISRVARDRASTYSTAFQGISLFLLMIGANLLRIDSLAIESIILFVLFAFSFYCISYMIVWKKEYYR